MKTIAAGGHLLLAVDRMAFLHQDKQLSCAGGSKGKELQLTSACGLTLNYQGRAAWIFLDMH